MKSYSSSKNSGGLYSDKNPLNKKSMTPSKLTNFKDPKIQTSNKAVADKQKIPERDKINKIVSNKIGGKIDNLSEKPSQASKVIATDKISKIQSIQKQLKCPLPIKETKTVPEPQRIGNIAIRYWRYYYNKKNNKVYFYPFVSNEQGECRYIQIKEEPKMTEDFVSQIQSGGMFNGAIYAVPADIAFKKFEQFKKEGKYQRPVNLFDKKQLDSFPADW